MTHTTKMLGAWGWVAALVLGVFGSLVPGAGLLALAGMIAVFVAYLRAGEELGRPAVRSNAIIALVVGVIGSAVMFTMVGASIMAILMRHGHGGMGAMGGGVIAGGVISWVLYIVASWFWYKASAELAEAGDAPLLKTGALLGFIGALTLVLFGLGGLIGLVGSVLQCIAFFGARESEPALPA